MGEGWNDDVETCADVMKEIAIIVSAKPCFNKTLHPPGPSSVQSWAQRQSQYDIE